MSARAKVSAAGSIPRREPAVSPLRRWLGARRPLLRFVARLLAYGAAFYAMTFAPFWQEMLGRYLNATACLANLVLHAFHQPTQQLGANVCSPHYAISVTPGCSAGELITFFWAGLLAFPAPGRHRAVGLALGTALVVLLNVMRIVAVFLVGTSHAQLTEAVHEELCPGLLEAATLLLVLGWIWWVSGARQIPPLLGRFVLIFTIFFGFSLGFTNLGGAGFRSLGAAAFSSSEGERELTFEPNGSRHTTVAIVNRTLMNPDGSGPVRNLDLDTFAFFWRPTLLVIALSLASPLTVARRLKAAGVGVLCVWAYAWVALSLAIWNESSEVVLVTLSPFWKAAANETQAVLLAQFGIAVPVLVWALCAFQPPDATPTQSRCA